MLMSFEVGVVLDFRSPQWVMNPVETPLRCWGPVGGGWLEETLQAFVLELIELVCAPASLQPATYAPRILLRRP